MDSIKKENLNAAGIDLDEALDRFMGNEGMLNRFLVKFLADGNYGKLEASAAERNIEDMLTASHTLKGVCGNLAFTALFELLTDQVRLLREGDLDKAVDLMADISEGYEKVTAAIKENCM